MDDYLYIIIGIVWVVYSLYSNKQKQIKKKLMEEQRKSQPNQSTRVPEPQRPRSILEQLLNPEPELPKPQPVAYDEYVDDDEANMTEMPEIKHYQPEYQSREIIQEEVSADYFDSQYASRKETNYYDSREVLASAYDEEILQEYIHQEFDIRKAVIFSEILNPKYI